MGFVCLSSLCQLTRNATTLSSTLRNGFKLGLLFVQNEQLRQDVVDYQRQIDSLKEAIPSRRGVVSDYTSQLSKRSSELVQYLDEIQVKIYAFRWVSAGVLLTTVSVPT